MSGCTSHWHCNPTEAAHACFTIDRSVHCPRCGEMPNGLSEAVLFTMTEDGEDLLDAMHRLATNLRIAAFGCKAYDLGANPPEVEPAQQRQLKTGVAVIPGAVWRPGCQRSVP